VPSLDALLRTGFEVAAVVTNPDRPAGRGLAPRSPPVKAAAEAAGIEVLQPRSARDEALHRRIEGLAPDVGVVVAYGRILPGALLEVPRFGFVNVHFSLLPAYRGPAPVQRAIMDGATHTGVSIIFVTEGMDEGPVLAVRPVAIDADDTAGSLGARLSEAGAALLVDTLRDLERGAVEARPQDDSAATYAPKVSPDEARIDWASSCASVRNLVRALNPEPGAWTTFRSARVRIHSATFSEAAPAPSPGALEARGEVLVGCGGGALALGVVQPAGRRAMAATEWARGARLEPGAAFE
jgi:methionyl-tRNA formyltransferase